MNKTSLMEADNLLALCDVPGMPDQWDARDGYMHGWNDCLRALANGVESVDGAPIPDGYRVAEFIPGKWCWDLQDELGGWSGDGSYYSHYAAAAIGAWRDYADTLERAAMDEASAHDAAHVDRIRQRVVGSLHVAAPGAAFPYWNDAAINSLPVGDYALAAAPSPEPR